MSKEAMAAFHRLRLPRARRLDGTARLVLYHLCWRHDLSFDCAWPSTAKIAADLDIHRSAVIGAIGRLVKEQLITRQKGGGRGHSTRYRLNFLAVYRLAPHSKEPIVWVAKLSDAPDSLKVSDRPDSLDAESVRWKHLKCPVEAPKVSDPPVTKRKKTNKSPPAGTEGAGGPHLQRGGPADRAFRELHEQRQLALLALVAESARPARADAGPTARDSGDGGSPAPDEIVVHNTLSGRM